MPTAAPPPDGRELGAFSHVDRTDADEFIARLDAMRLLPAFQAYKRITIERMRLQSGMSAADIGSGTGEDARTLAEAVGPSGRGYGFDLSEAMVAISRRRHGDLRNLTYEQTPADGIRLPDAALDAIRADRLLIHVPSASASLDEMLRVLKPGGRIVVSEPDMPSFWLASGDHAMTALVARAIAASCVSPYLPRELWEMFRDRGLREIEFEVRAMTSLDLESAAKILDFETVLSLMVQKGLATADQAKSWLDDVAQRGRDNRFVATLNIVIAAATKP